MKNIFKRTPKTNYPCIRYSWLEKIRIKLEWKIFSYFLKRFCVKDLDQWERWKLNTKYGPVFIQISRQDDGYNWDELK